ncbi:hypothetical protein SEVIR_2G308901v4 [Setaria viridis]
MPHPLVSSRSPFPAAPHAIPFVVPPPIPTAAALHPHRIVALRWQRRTATASPRCRPSPPPNDDGSDNPSCCSCICFDIDNTLLMGFFTRCSLPPLTDARRLQGSPASGLCTTVGDR